MTPAPPIHDKTSIRERPVGHTQIFSSTGRVNASVRHHRGAIYRTGGLASLMDLREVFAANLRRLRNAKGVSQDELAHEANVSRSYLSQLEKGTFYASLNVVGRLAEALDVEPAELLKMPQKRMSRSQ